jgi:hypothetical protein
MCAQAKRSHDRNHGVTEVLTCELQSFPLSYQHRKERGAGLHYSVKFRDWLANASCTDQSIIKEYLNSLDAPKGFFETKTGKVTKSIVMTALGTGAGRNRWR